MHRDEQRTGVGDRTDYSATDPRLKVLAPADVDVEEDAGAGEDEEVAGVDVVGGDVAKAEGGADN